MADRWAGAFVEAVQPGGRAKAVKVMEESALQQPLSSEEQFHLARLYEQEDNWPRANEHFRSALAADPQNPFCLATYAAGLLQHEGAEEARSWVDRLEKAEPESSRTKDLREKVRAQVTVP